jgi:hypothetical protein
MDKAIFYYTENSNIAVADSSPQNGRRLRVKTIWYPMLAKSVAAANSGGPIVGSTNEILISRDGGADLQIIYAEGFPTIDQLQSDINQSIFSAFSTVTDPIRLVLVGGSQMLWDNPDTVPYKINYINTETKNLIEGTADGVLSLTVLSSSTSHKFNPNPRLGLSSFTFNIVGGQNLEVNATGGWLDNVAYTFTDNTFIDFSNAKQCTLRGEYASLKIQQDLVCPRNDQIKLSYYVD